MKLFWIIVFVAVVLTMAYGSQKQLHSEHEKIAVWVVAGIVLVMGIAAIAGMLR